MVSVVEDAPVNVVLRSDTQIPVEEPQPITMNSIHEDETVPGGSAQTRDYYSDSSSRRRRSLDRSNSIRKTAAAVVAEIDELKSASASNAKVSPANVDYFHGPKVVVPDRDSNSNSLRDDCSETFEMGFGDQASIVGNGERKGAKKSRRWSKAWNFWGFYTGEVSTKMRTRIGNRKEAMPVPAGAEQEYGRARDLQTALNTSDLDIYFGV
ncbi:hypothetical protein GH714_017001 [Hevea brasiliensis]|uniref:Uncharacterized protein n=1 Tax=Hevea brasiliensis TaxID=3981 RepID=A0A6A6M154_HEVBR|nr:hypothetical protein GH714_017001 [Hevea brasiliensis]